MHQYRPEVVMMGELFEIIIAVVVIWLIYKFIRRYLMM